jgi:diacylglycerol kinase (ATP)
MADSSGGIAPRGPIGVWRALLWSLKGIGAAWRVESSFRLEVYLFVPLAPIALWYGDGAIEKALLIGSLMLVLSAELMNSAIEAVIARYGDDHHELTGRAKDMGSAAVFVLMLNVILVWSLLLGPRYLVPLFSG